MTNSIIEARKMASRFSYKTQMIGIDQVKVKGHLERREDEYEGEGSLYLINEQGEMNLYDALDIAMKHSAEVEITLKFATPVNLSGTEKEAS